MKKIYQKQQMVYVSMVICHRQKFYKLITVFLLILIISLFLSGNFCHWQMNTGKEFEEQILKVFSGEGGGLLKVELKVIL